MAFADLKSEEAQARLSVCQPISGLQEVTRVGGVERYAHQSGEALHLCLVVLSFCRFVCSESPPPESRNAIGAARMWLPCSFVSAWICDDVAISVCVL